MTILYKDISNLIPFEVNDLINVDSIQIIDESPCEQFVHKQNLHATVLNPEFLIFLKSKNIEIEKVTIWHWFCTAARWAHIDCSTTGEILPAALNWTLEEHSSQVNFYDLPNVDKTVRFGNEVDTGWRTDNVTAYIPVNVEGLTPNAVWSNRGPVLINTSVPHLIIAPEMRRSVTLGIRPPVPIEVLLERLQS